MSEKRVVWARRSRVAGVAGGVGGDGGCRREFSRRMTEEAGDFAGVLGSHAEFRVLVCIYGLTVDGHGFAGESSIVVDSDNPPTCIANMPRRRVASLAPSTCPRTPDGV